MRVTREDAAIRRGHVYQMAWLTCVSCGEVNFTYQVVRPVFVAENHEEPADPALAR